MGKVRLKIKILRFFTALYLTQVRENKIISPKLPQQFHE